ncbi:MAG: hypothetical protein GX801_11820 [Fibrobacter sp.]|nr:hypothetical protein [Fibrobacter sp.]
MKKLTIFFAILISISCAKDTSKEQAAVSTVKEESKAAPALAKEKSHSALPTLYFFINPGGRPCQIQDEILKNSPDLKNHAQLKYISTNVPTDRDMFYKYGVRSLPSLILVDQKDSTLHRFPPGIHQYDVLKQVFDKGVK